MSKDLPDVQKSKDKRGIALDRVGCTNMEIPIKIKRKGSDVVDTVHAIFNGYASLDAEAKGISMSRFPQVIIAHESKCFFGKSMKILMEKLSDRLESDDVYLECKFKYYIEKKAPISKQASYMYVDVKFIGLNTVNGFQQMMEVKVPINTCCPCSKAMSDQNAHNQRAYAIVRIELEDDKMIWIEDLVKTIEFQASTQIYNVLKRPDEQYVTDDMYRNAKFVEDVCRDISLSLEQSFFNQMSWYKVRVDSIESIHSFDATAIVSREKHRFSYSGGREVYDWIKSKKGLSLY